MVSICRLGGTPGVGIHMHLWGVAVMDVLGTIIGAVIIGKMAGWNAFYVFIVLMIIGTMMHVACGVNTALTNFIGLS